MLKEAITVSADFRYDNEKKICVADGEWGGGGGKSGGGGGGAMGGREGGEGQAETRMIVDYVGERILLVKLYVFSLISAATTERASMWLVGGADGGGGRGGGSEGGEEGRGGEEQVETKRYVGYVGERIMLLKLCVWGGFSCDHGKRISVAGVGRGGGVGGGRPKGLLATWMNE